jgi:hypothetical protein
LCRADCGSRLRNSDPSLGQYLTAPICETRAKGEVIGDLARKACDITREPAVCFLDDSEDQTRADVFFLRLAKAPF